MEKKSYLKKVLVEFGTTFSQRRINNAICIVIFIAMSFGTAFSQAECGCDHVISPSDSPPGQVITKDGAAMNVQPGDKVCIMAGNYNGRLELLNFQGSSLEPILIVNCGGQAVISNYVTNKPAINVLNSKHFKLSGRGHPGFDYGIKIDTTGQNGLSLGAFSTDFEIEGFDIAHTGFAGIINKTDPSCGNRDLRWFVQKNSIFHDNYIHHTHGEAFYIGSTNYPTRIVDCSGQTVTLYAHSMEGVKIYNNIVEHTGWDGIQIGATTKDGAIFDNTIRNYGTRRKGAHSHGIQLSNDVLCSVYNNKILPVTPGGRSGYGNGIFSKAAVARIFNNLIVNPGDLDSAQRMGIQFNRNSNPIPDSSHYVINNTIINPARAGISMFHDNVNNKFNNNIIVSHTGLYIIDTKPPETDTSYNYRTTSIANPGFSDSEYHLSENSPCRDNGVNRYADGVTFDLDYNPRPASGPFDQGAYQYAPSPGSDCANVGSIMREVYTGITGNQVSDLTGHASYPNSPSTVEMLTSLFETTTNYGDHYGQRVRGYVCPPTSGIYYFYISGNDFCELWLSTSDDPANKVKIAEVPGATLVREWDKYPAQRSVGINLSAGQMYYIEALHKEGVNNDNLAVGWELPGGGLEQPIPASRLVPPQAAPPICSASGTILREQYNTIEGSLVSDLTADPDYPDNPSITEEISIFEGPTNTADHYGTRIRGYICAPATGNYRFYISGNDRAELWLSTGSNSADKTLIAYVPAATAVREWNKFTEQESRLIPLVADNTYYIEALHKEGVNSDHIAVGWQLPNLTLERPIPGTRLSPPDESSLRSTSSARQSIDDRAEGSTNTMESSISVYPNPAKNSFSVSMPSSRGENYRVRLMDIYGRLLKEVNAGSADQPIEVSDVPQGLYILDIIQNNAVTRKRLRIERK